MNLEEELDRLRSRSAPEICHYLAMKVRKYRQDRNLSQAEFAKRAVIALRTFKRFESHGQANLETFVEALRAMGRAQYLFMLFGAAARAAPPAPTLKDKLLRARLSSRERLLTTKGDANGNEALSERAGRSPA